MSRTIDVGVHEKSFYGHMAKVMEERLWHIARRKKITKTSIPSGVLREAERFFVSVCEAFEKEVPVNPPASRNDYWIALDCVGRALQIGSHEMMDKKLVAYKVMLASLRSPRELSGKEFMIIDEMCLFFAKLAED